jgi:hypothetical protein
MVDVEPQLQDHAVGLEMQIVELARQADQAAHDGWPDREAVLRKELEGLYSELASVAERLTTDTATPQSASFVVQPPAPEDSTA